MGRAGGGAEASRGPGLLPHEGVGRGATRWRASPTSTGPAPRPTTVFFIQAFCRLVAGMYSGRRDRFVFVFVTFRRVVELSPLLRPSPVID